MSCWSLVSQAVITGSILGLLERGFGPWVVSWSRWPGNHPNTQDSMILWYVETEPQQSSSKGNREIQGSWNERNSSGPGTSLGLHKKKKKETKFWPHKWNRNLLKFRQPTVVRKTEGPWGNGPEPRRGRQHREGPAATTPGLRHWMMQKPGWSLSGSCWFVSLAPDLESDNAWV